MKRQITLLTGIPRSGTTLCCHVLNDTGQAIALHEPINPQTLQSDSKQHVLDEISEKIDHLNRAIETGSEFDHGDSAGLSIDNPVGESRKNGIRQVRAVRGKLRLSPQPTNIQLCVKQNALFTALLPELQQRFPVIGIVRNPVDVLLSWLNVDLPVNRGHIPAGERFDTDLRQRLAAIPLAIERQLLIYAWFTKQFTRAGIPVLRYEDIVESNGGVLLSAMNIEAKGKALSPRARTYRSEHLSTLSPHLDALKAATLYYSQDDIQHAFETCART